MGLKKELGAESLEHWLCGKEELPSARRLVGLSSLEKALVLAALVARDARPKLVVFSSRADARNAIDNFKFFGGDEVSQRVHYLPNLDFDCYRGLLPNPEILCERNVGLFHALNDSKGRLFVTHVGALLQKVVPPAEFLRATTILSPNDEIARDTFLAGLVEAGYQRQPTALDPGIFSVRGGVIDIFCPLYDKPVRIEFFGDLIDEIRFFDPHTQRSLEKMEKVFIIPVGQSIIPHGADYGEAAAKVKERLDHIGIPRARRDEVLETIKGGALPSELCFLFPLLSKGSAAISGYLPPETLVLWDGAEKVLEAASEIELPRIKKSLELFEKEPLPIAAGEELFVTRDELDAQVHQGNSLFFEDFGGSSEQLQLSGEPVSFAVERGEARGGGAHPALGAFATRFRDWMDLGFRIHVVCHTRTHAERIAGLFANQGIGSTIHGEEERPFPTMLDADFARLQLWQGFVTESRSLSELKTIILSEEEIFGQKKRVSKSSSWTTASDPARLLSSFRDLKVNDFVVHKDHGIGKYLGLKSMNFLGVENEYVLLEYKDSDKLYIPVYRLNVLQKYVGGESASPVLDKLGGDRWIKAKGRAQRAVQELAAEFLNIQAKRKLVTAHAFSAVGQDYNQFEMEFPFDETPDQMKAIDEVMNDMGQPHPMDRLVCGDVGYGKTEVAMRAAYRAVIDGKQVAVLVPTTVLAFQHFENFKKRFQGTGVRIDMVSRLRSSVEVKQALVDLADGKVDIIIGTHRLLSPDVRPKDLGLVVVDEEHRFGVVHKERLKKLMASVHVLSMTATPIPRTLNMAMTGIKEISIITTPPPDRLSVRTFVCRSTPEVITEAISNELARDGQVFFVHNRVQSIFKVADELRQLLPKLKVEVVHGQMDGDELEKRMLAFYAGEAQVLLTTTIIESGLDIPRANTIIMDEAQNFGLAQLYQLRGRVGRSEKRAYCYLLVPGENLIGDEAKQRLQVIQRYTDLGSGFSIASHDLEIRGAGDLLGKDQSGHLSAIGIDMYFELLEESIRALNGQEQKVEIEPEISMQITASFPTDYLPDIGERVLLYRRLSSVEHEEAISEIESEIRDRFGAPPTEVINLLGLMKIKLYLKRLHVVRMSCGPKKTSLQFAPSTPASPERLVRLMTKDDPEDRYALTPDQKLVVEVKDTTWPAQLREIQRLCDYLGVG